MFLFLRNKKLFLIIGFLGVVIIAGYLLYVLFFRPSPEPVPITPEPGATTTSGLPIATTGPGQIISEKDRQKLPVDKTELKKQPNPIAAGGLTQTTELNQTTSLGSTLGGDGRGVQYYDQNNGKFYRLDQDGQAVPLSDKIFHDVESIAWSPEKNKAILEYPDGANIMYDFDAQKQITLPQHWKEFNFSPSGDQIVMKSIGLDPDNRWLAVSSPDGSVTRPIEPLGTKDATVYPGWSPNNQIVAMYTEGVDFNRQEVFFVGLNQENFKSTVVEGRGFEPKWSPTGDRLLYSVYSHTNDLKPNLWIVNAQGDSIGANRKNLNIETWADKCVFANNLDLFCAVPKQLEEGAGLFPELAKNAVDNLYKINTRTGLKKLVAVPDGDFNMSNLIIASNGSLLYFTDDKTGKLYSIRLK